MLVDLLPLELQMLDVILGMDFLYTHYASMDFHKKEVIFITLGLAKMVFRVEVQEEKLKLEDVLIMNEFLDISSTDLPDHKSLKYIFDKKELNLRQMRWLKLIKDHDRTIEYHLSKANLVVDALSRKSRLSKTALCSIQASLLSELRGFRMVVIAESSGSLSAKFEVRSSLVAKIVRRQQEDSNLQKMIGKSMQDPNVEFELRGEKAIVKQGRLCIPSTSELKDVVLEEAHSSAYAMHLGSTKMYRTLKKTSGGLVIVDKLTKTAQFIPIKATSTLDQLAKLYVNTIVSGQLERTIQTLEDMLRACVLQFKGSRDTRLSLMNEKLSPRYIGPYKIRERVGPVGYRLELPTELARIHDIFHVSMLRKYILDLSHVLQAILVELKEDLSYEEEAFQILDRKEQVLRNKAITLVKVLWRHHGINEATWESEDQMWRSYPTLFP
ncbi:Retrotransposable element Tf2 [Cucumis melo var. makuwa]|uniref:Retrotransposable element Tf2 n=1 Tax=Cucumis melo var. makuwa TaxID=1194695 RepID=A0A5A7TB71_CUCMM|nr:Retrotransposable element Tf2 [Cucumis melo var. makuwa]TYK05593.1 Retrotransposable element Tf2 [Cucumis melo var. makuwa]